jgi:catechol 2,3-dioxygenase-like lactoylglutathione lyase family enzyme
MPPEGMITVRSCGRAPQSTGSRDWAAAASLRRRRSPDPGNRLQIFLASTCGAELMRESITSSAEARSLSAAGRLAVTSSISNVITSISRERSAWTAAHGLCSTRDMTIKRLDHVSVVVDDLAAAIAFFTALGMTLAGEMPVEGPWVDRVNGLESVQVDIVMMRTPDGHGRLELTKFRNPKPIDIEPAIAPPNTLGLRSVMFTVESVDDTVARLRANGAELVGEVAQYKDMYRLCYMRGPAGIIVALAEELF